MCSNLFVFVMVMSFFRWDLKTLKNSRDIQTFLCYIEVVSQGTFSHIQQSKYMIYKVFSYFISASFCPMMAGQNVSIS